MAEQANGDWKVSSLKPAWIQWDLAFFKFKAEMGIKKWDLASKYVKYLFENWWLVITATSIVGLDSGDKF